MNTLRVICLIQSILSILLMFYTIYQLVVSLFAYSKSPKKQRLTKKKHKIMALISARNEELVIKDLIESLKGQDYPKDKLDICVIADNCTDNTASVARDAGAIVYERFDETKKSKGYAMEWFFNILLKEFPDKYDAFCVFDADNLVAPNFVSKMNKKLCEGEKIVQGYRDIKNVTDNWISANYAIFYWTWNRFYGCVRDKLGLTPLINGTGFMVSMDVIKEDNGWHTETLTEDTEFSLKSAAKGIRVGWAHDAVVYDEQPTEFKQAWTQRLRWGVGTIQCLKCCMPRLIKSKKITPAKIDAFIYMLGMPIIMLSVMVTFFDIVKMFFMPLGQAITMFGSKLLITAIFAIIGIAQAVITVALEKKSFKDSWKGIITYPIFLLTCVAVNFVAFFNMNLTWQPIKHVKSVKINELR